MFELHHVSWYPRGAASQAQLQQLTAAVRLYKALGGGWRETGAGRR